MAGRTSLVQFSTLGSLDESVQPDVEPQIAERRNPPGQSVRDQQTACTCLPLALPVRLWNRVSNEHWQTARGHSTAHLTVRSHPTLLGSHGWLPLLVGGENLFQAGLLDAFAVEFPLAAVDEDSG